MHIVPFFCMCLFIIDRLWVRKNAIGLLFIKIFFFCGCVDHHFVWMCLFYYRHWLPLCWFYKIYFFRWLSEHICNQICNHLFYCLSKLSICFISFLLISRDHHFFSFHCSPLWLVLVFFPTHMAHVCTSKVNGFSIFFVLFVPQFHVNWTSPCKSPCSQRQ